MNETMDLLLKEINASNDIDTQLCFKREPLDNSNIEPIESVIASDWSSKRIKNEVESEAEIRKIPSKKRKVQKANRPNTKRVHSKGKSDRTQLPCIINIKSSAVFEETTQTSHNGICDTSNERFKSSSQPWISPKTCESNDHITLTETIGLNSLNDTITSKICQSLVDIRSVLEGLKAEIAENTKKIDQLEKFLPQIRTWKSVKNYFNFPVSTDEQLLELEKKLEDYETASKLFADLTNRHFNSWREMVLVSLKYMLSRNVAMLYNLNGRKGTKKKFRDLNMCNILVASVQHKYKEAATPDILKRISLILAGSGDWEGSRKKK